jgi:hypothetical protein
MFILIQILTVFILVFLVSNGGSIDMERETKGGKNPS